MKSGIKRIGYIWRWALETCEIATASTLGSVNYRTFEYVDTSKITLTIGHGSNSIVNGNMLTADTSTFGPLKKIVVE